MDEAAGFVTLLSGVFGIIVTYRIGFSFIEWLSHDEDTWLKAFAFWCAMLCGVMVMDHYAEILVVVGALSIAGVALCDIGYSTLPLNWSRALLAYCIAVFAVQYAPSSDVPFWIWLSPFVLYIAWAMHRLRG
jgi:hypothetical protein